MTWNTVDTERAALPLGFAQRQEARWNRSGRALGDEGFVCSAAT
jgi:hypothetical protein